MQVFVLINDFGIKINEDVSVKNSLTKEFLTKDLFEILANVNMNVINHLMLENI